jgi:hypothetical protein
MSSRRAATSSRRAAASRRAATAAYSVSCKLALKVGLRIVAGCAPWSWCNESHRTITCGKLESGTVVLGTLIETGLPETAKATPAPVSSKQRQIEALEKLVAELKAEANE